MCHQSIATLVCATCQQAKPTTEFYPRETSKTGYRHSCKACYAAQRRAYYTANAERILAEGRAKRAATRPVVVPLTDEQRKIRARERARQWYADNTDRAKDNARSYAVQQPDRVRAWKATNRARSKGVPGSFTGEQWAALCEVHDNRCAACGADVRLTVDHIIPMAQGGSNDISNIQPLCLSCNASKHAKIIDYRVTKGDADVGVR